LTLARILTPAEQALGNKERGSAFMLSRALPRLSAEARRLSTNVVAGIHGRRRAGTGETFWQFRSFVPGEATTRIDWRRSARDDRIIIRDREWEAAQSVWLWIDRSPSMAFISDTASASKLERAVVIGLALADMLVRGGERVGLLGLTPAQASRNIISRLGEILALDPGADAELPPQAVVPMRGEAVIISDFISPLDDIRARLRDLAGARARGHMVAVVDPVEETFPFTGHNEFTGTEGGLRMRVGDAGSFAQAYKDRMALHREGLRDIAKELGWSFVLHRTDRSPAQLLLALRMVFESGASGAPTTGAPNTGAPDAGVPETAGRR
jgi:uncharacterized protein (DUF58 family)